MHVTLRGPRSEWYSSSSRRGHMRRRMTDAQRAAFAAQTAKNITEPSDAQREYKRRVANPETNPIIAKRPAPRTWTAEEVREQERAIGVLLTNAVDTHGIVTALRNKWGIGHGRAHKLIERVRRQWIEDSQTNSYANKVEAERRLLDGIKRAREAGKWSAVASFERTLANIQGTLEPMRIDVNVRQSGAIVEIMASMTGEELEQLAARAAERNALYERWRAGQLPPAPQSVEVVEAVDLKKVNGV